MGEDIVDLDMLRCSLCYKYPNKRKCFSCAVADEIERLREIAEAADSYHDVACNPDWCRLCRAISAWKEARRG